MEAAVVSGILKTVSNKLAPLLIKEYSLIVGVQKHLLELKDQVQEINYRLEAVGDNVSPDTPAFNWLRKLKDIAYDVDDIVDEFQMKADKHDAHGAAGVMSRYMCDIPKSLGLQCKAASKLKAVKKRFDAIAKQRTEFNAIANSLLAGHSARDMRQTTVNQTTLPTVDVASVLGRDEEKHHIISKLVDDKHTIKTVSIIGLGGSGKTTLAQLVFNDCSIVKEHFDVRLWVHVSQEFDVDKLIKKLFEAFSDKDPGQHALPYMIKTISDKLNGKRLLLVLDDVWTESLNQWEKFMVHLKSSAPGSRILLTARSRRVAETVRSVDKFDLPFLSLEDSWQLFQQCLAIPAEDLESEFVNVGKEIVKKCGGVPLAIKSLAGVLNGMEQIQEWESMRNSNVLDVEGIEHIVSACLRLSYLNLPSHLKQCFTICSLFPKGHNIDKEQLIDLWISHDMITVEDPSDYLNSEYVGHKYFNSLLEVSFLQNVKEEDGRVTCGMHDLVHDLAFSILGDEISLDMPNEATTSTTKCYRYFSVIKRPEHTAPKNIFGKARAIYMADDYKECINGMALKHAKHLRSVTVGFLSAETAETISQIKYLKYLEVSQIYCETLPKAITNIWSLQALHVTYSYSLEELPQSIGKLKRLRTLKLSNCWNLNGLPESIGDCQMITSIDLQNCRKLTVLPDSIGRNEKLRVLRLGGTKIDRLPSSITTLRNLECLDLQHCRELVELPEGIGNLHKLQILNLKDCVKLGGVPSSITKLRYLERLDLQGWGQLVELPEGVCNLEKLKVLNLKYCDKLGGMPIGIGQCSRLQKLCLFVVGKGENCAGISELANVSSIGEELRIRGLSYVLDPNDAHVACLKQKTNLQRLFLEWMPMADDIEEVNTDLQQDVLDGLEAPPGIQVLEIHWYSGRQYARWMQSQVGGGVQGLANFPFLRVMKLHDFPNLKHLHGLVELPCLEELEVRRMPSLKSISGGPFPSLVKMEMSRLPCLGVVWIVAERTIPDGEQGGCCCNFTTQLGHFRVGNCLAELAVSDCPKLEVRPHLPLTLQHLDLVGREQLLQAPGQCQGSSSSPSFNKLKKLELWKVTGLGSGHGWELLQHMTTLESLEITFFSGVQTKVPESLWNLTSLQSLKVARWSSMRMLPESLGELRFLQELTIKFCDRLTSLPQTMGQLTSLQVLKIELCDALQQLPDCLGELCSLRKLQIGYLRELTCLPQSICRLTTSLEDLQINNCSGIKSLPEGIKNLTALKRLRITWCPDLQRRCKRETGEDWHLISHIADVIM